MAILVLAEHDNAALKLDTAKIVTAGRAVGDEVHVLVAGHQCGGGGQAAQAIPCAADRRPRAKEICGVTACNRVIALLR